MTTRNFRVNNGLEVGDITISANANTITGGATAAPNADGQFANKKYVDDQISAISTTAITSNNTNATVSDSGSNGTLTVTCDGNTELTITDTAATFSGNVIITGDLEVNGTNNKWDGGNQNDIYITPGTIYKLSKEWEIGIAAPIGTTKTSDDYRVVGYLMWEFELD